MAQIFNRSMNPLGRIVILGLPLIFAGTALGLAAFYRSGYATGMNEVIEQPIPFSHQHHVKDLGIDCRYCHNSIETSSYAGIPPTKICMNCHQQIWTGAELLEPVRQSFKLDKPIVWKKVHNLPDYAYFNHSIHIGKGVGCVECHGQVNEMPLVFQSKTLLMEWCVKCHREPDSRLRPREEVFNMTWKPSNKTINPKTGEFYPTDPAELAKLLKQNHGIRDAMTLTSCSMCHR
ncbi:MAG: cytochrome c family protein [Planctomycetes bacterium]|nr:cytochrome c family protein [Planctomycetota bacterium]